MATPSPAERRVHRCVWLYAQLRNHGAVDFRAYADRFQATIRSYYRDLDLLQRIGITLQSERDHGRVIFIGEAL